MKLGSITIRLNELGKRMEANLPQATQALATAITENVGNAEPTIPVDTGELWASEIVTYPGPNQARITYGGERAPYAGVVHEGFPHLPGPIKWTRLGSGPFFFQKKLSDKQYHADYAKRVVQALKGIFR